MSSSAVVKFIRNETVQKRIEELLGSRTAQITTSLITAVNNNDKLAACRPETVLNAALTAASMDLPINANLGFAYIIPYEINKKITDENGREKWVKESEAQFQMGYKGFIQLAQRSGYYKTINASDVREGELKVRNRLTGEIDFGWIEDEAERNSKPVIGYVGYFELLNGFTKSLYMNVDQIERHAVKYSKSYSYDKERSKNSSKWTTDFDVMALKTVTKLLVSKYGPLSTQLQEAIEKDQAVISDEGITYIDNDKPEPFKRRGRWVPSDDLPMTENQQDTMVNLLRQHGVEGDDAIETWVWDNYGVDPKTLTQAQAQQINDDCDTRGNFEAKEEHEKFIRDKA